MFHKVGLTQGCGVYTCEVHIFCNCGMPILFGDTFDLARGLNRDLGSLILKEGVNVMAWAFMFVKGPLLRVEFWCEAPKRRPTVRRLGKN